MKTRRNNKRPIKHGIKTRSKRQKGSGNRWSRIGCTTHQNNMDEEDPNSIHDYLQLVIEDEDALHVKKYLKKGANPNVMITDEHEYLQEPELVPAIIYVARHIQPSTILKYLVQFGASVERDPNTGSTPLIEAAEWGNLSAVEYLLDIGVDINATTGSGVTAIGYAVLNEDIPMIKLMLKERKGEIDFNYSVFGDNENVIEDTKNPEVARILKNYAIEQQIPIHLGRQYHRLQVGDVMDKKRMPRDLTHLLVTKYAGGKGKTCSKRQEGGAGKKNRCSVNPEANKMLLEGVHESCLNKIETALTNYDADINVKGTDGNTALHAAIEDGDIGIVDVLLKNGADIYIKNKDGRDAIKLARKYNRNEYIYEDGPILTLIKEQDVKNKINEHLNDRCRRVDHRNNFANAVKGRIPDELVFEGLKYIGGKRKTRKSKKIV
jgi:ankyrin repeat protein